MYLYTVIRKKDKQTLEVYKCETREGFKFSEKYSQEDDALIFELSHQ